MNNTDSLHEQEFVPEVDAASLLGANLPPPPSPMPLQPVPATVASTEFPDNPIEAMKLLPPVLAAHIQDLLAQADAEGYLRGRNEVIEATQHFDAPDDSKLSPAPFPRYNRLTIWDL